MNKFRKWLIHKLGGILKEEQLVNEYKIIQNTCPLITIADNQLIDNYTLVQYDGHIEDIMNSVKDQIAYNISQHMLAQNLIHFDEEEVHYGKIIRGIVKFVKDWR